MRDVLGPGTILGYCSNVHAGANLAEVRANLERYAAAVKRRVCPDEPMGVGLWFSAKAAKELTDPEPLAGLRAFLDEHGLLAYTLNGFPYDAFHHEVVKRRVYEPDWTTQARQQHTKRLVDILTVLLPEAAEGSISSLPLGWPGMFDLTEANFNQAAGRLLNLVGYLAKVHRETGRLIHLDIEPEPGCVLDTARSVVWFFENYLLKASSGSAALAAVSDQPNVSGPLNMHPPGIDEDSIRRHLRVCHDVCHGAVMFEPQAQALATYRKAGIGVGKAQLSSAIDLPLVVPVASTRQAAFEQLRGFCEQRYLHQTNVLHNAGEQCLYPDLPDALDDEALGQTLERAEVAALRVHFHVPVYLERFDHLRTTHQAIRDWLAALRPEDDVHHFEVETYAWNVLPTDLQAPHLDEGIARELEWVNVYGPRAKAQSRDT